jgi:predicted RNA-binding protein
MIIKNYIEVNNKKYSYFIEPINDEISKIICKSAKIEQEFLNEDLVQLLKDLPNLIISEQQYKDKKENIVRFRVSSIEKVLLQKKAKES